VGGVSERAGAKAGGSNPSARYIPSRVVAVKGILAFRRAVSLRGAPSERRPRSVRIVGGGSSAANDRADDSGCPEVAEEGNAVSMRQQRARTHRRHERSSQANRGRVLRSVLRPVHVNPHYAPQGKPSEVGRQHRHHGWANSRK